MLEVGAAVFKVQGGGAGMRIIEAAVIKHMEFPDQAAVLRYLTNLRSERKNYRIISDLDYGDKRVLVIAETWRNAVFMKKVTVM